MGQRQSFITALIQHLGPEKSWTTICRRVRWLEASQPVWNLDWQGHTSKAATADSWKVVHLCHAAGGAIRHGT